MDTTRTPLQADLVAMLQALRSAEQDLFAMVPPETREAAGTIGDWSPNDRSSTDVLCECDDGSVAGIGANGVNHAVGHLPEIADLVGGGARFDTFATFAREVETILRAGHVPPRDSGTILYNIACAQALSGELDDARRLLSAAFARRHDLANLARDDSDLAALGGELI